MDLSTRGALRLFRVADVDVYLHWSWFLIAFWQLQLPRAPQIDYEAPLWKLAEYLALFGIVLLHEFGHALACRSVGGQADRIVLWPLGGVAFVAPPPRPGAVLWSIAGGPLVNLALILPLGGLSALGQHHDWATTWRDLDLFLHVLTWINLGLLALNLIPVYPLDGGQIMQALLWFPLGRWQSLRVVSLLGAGFGGVLVLAGSCIFLLAGIEQEQGYLMLSALFLLIGLFVVLRSLVAFQQAAAGLSLLALPRHTDCACPSCEVGPPRGDFWVCDHCRTRFDLFGRHGQCPACGAWYLHPACVHCRQKAHIDRWFDPSIPEEARPEPAQEAPPTEA